MKEYKQLSLEERKEVYVMKKEGKGVRSIARNLKRSGSTITRELQRNIVDERIGYLPDEAHSLTSERKAKHGLKINRNPELKNIVIEQLKDGWSPEVIAGRMKHELFPLWVCHETIYQFIYGNEGKALGLFRFLLRARPRRGLIYARKPRSGIPERVSIHDRPEQIATRKEFGHLEGDLTFFTDNQSMNLGVIVERKTRLIQLILNQSKQTNVVMQGMFNKLAALPQEAKKSITFDNGLEFVRHTLLKKFMGIATYFCDKHSPWQKGQVEQMNCMLHRYLPKNSNLKEISYKKIEFIQDKLNNRPRKCLGFETPAEAFSKELNQSVALRA